MERKPKIIIDTDAGVDDAMAILMLLQAHKRNLVEVLAITTVNGNTNVQNVNINIFRILDCVKMNEIPVYSGAEVGLVSKFTFKQKPYFGQDGFGDAIKDEAPASLSLLRKETASLALIRLVQQNPGEVIVIALGPLTNLAISINICTEWSSLLRDLYVMGGNMAGVGNHSMCAEFNFLCDPEAAKVVVDRVQVPIKLTPWEACVPPLQISFEERRLLGEYDSAAARLVNQIDKYYTDSRFNCWLTCDQLTAAWLLDDYTEILRENFPSQQLVTKSTQLSATVEISGNHTRGQMVIDHYNKWNTTKNLMCMNVVNKEKYMNYLKLAFL